jgi:hypothetical protein
VLATLGAKIFATGPLGSGHAMKALNNYASAAGLVAAAEALLIGRRFGLDLAVMTDVLNASTGRNNSTENKLKQYILSGTFASGFSPISWPRTWARSQSLRGSWALPRPWPSGALPCGWRQPRGLVAAPIIRRSTGSWSRWRTADEIGNISPIVRCPTIKRAKSILVFTQQSVAKLSSVLGRWR